MAKQFNRDINLAGGARVVKDGDVIIDEHGNVEAEVTSSLASANIYVGNASGVSAEVAVSGDVTISNTGAVTIADSAVEPSMIGTETMGAGTQGIVRVVDFDSDTVKALLDGSSNSLNIGAEAGLMIIDFIIYTKTAAGTAGTVKVGTDANWNVASDDDAFVAAHDANAVGGYIMSRIDVAGAVAAVNGVAATGSSSLTIESSADLSATSWEGGAKVFFVE